MAVEAPFLGNYVLISVWDSGTTAEVELGHQTNVTFTESRPTIDITSKANTGATSRVSGRYSSSITCDALYVDNNVAYTALQARVRDGVSLKVTRKEPTNAAAVGVSTADLLECDAFVTGLTETFPMDGAGTVSCTLEVDGVWRAVTSTA
jgi:predicted secreted protein